MPADDEDPLSQLEELLEGLGRPSRYFDRDGTPLTTTQWVVKFDDESYQRIASDFLDEGNIWVSTVWLGLNHNFAGAGPPLIFETMVFVTATPKQLAERERVRRKLGFGPHEWPWEDLACERYSTEDEARDGHRQVVDSLRMRVAEVIEALQELE